MKDAFGGSIMIYLFMIFFVIYVALIGVALNFAKIYRIKNNVINILEQNQYSGDGSGIITEKLEDYLTPIYHTKFEGKLEFDKYCRRGEKTGDPSLAQNFGICVIQLGEEGKHYYLVKVYHVIDFPVLNIIDLPITASGETVVIN